MGRMGVRRDRKESVIVMRRGSDEEDGVIKMEELEV